MDERLHRRLADRIREIAAQRGIPITHLPDRAGVSRSHFWSVLGCRVSPSLDWLARVAAALRVDVSELLAPPRETQGKALAAEPEAGPGPPPQGRRERG